MAIKVEPEARAVVGGVDTHKDLHVAAVVDEQDRVLAPGCAPLAMSNASALSRRVAMAPACCASCSKLT
jgi:hypothetical protein